MKPELSIIIPCYNEAENIPILLEKFDAVISKYQKGKIELVLIDNNSKDNTNKVLLKSLPKYKYTKSFFEPIPGYGAAIKKGINSAEGEFVCWTHADLQTDPLDVLKAFEIINNEKDKERIFVKGNRKNRPFFDKFFEFGMSIFESVTLKTFLYDINAQPNLFHNSFLKIMENPPNDFSFDLYAYYLAKSNNYKIIRFPVLFPERIHGKSTWNTSLQSKIKFIKRTLDYSFKLKEDLSI
jgi:glycosyltransferase involved in cell wall biosynthesis